MKIWVYTRFQLSTEGNALINDLNAYGEDGWKLIQITKFDTKDSFGEGIFVRKEKKKKK